jgi:hypothetical protein
MREGDKGMKEIKEIKKQVKEKNTKDIIPRVISNAFLLTGPVLSITNSAVCLLESEARN